MRELVLRDFEQAGVNLPSSASLGSFMTLVTETVTLWALVLVGGAAWSYLCKPKPPV